jgi:hypothetical protein
VNNQEILDNAPDGATHVDSESDYYKINENVTEVMLNSLWFNAEDALMLPDDIRSLSDIKRIVELEKTEPLLQKVLDCCDSLHCEVTQANYGEAINWLRHISDAYANYQDLIDLRKGGAG